MNMKGAILEKGKESYTKLKLFLPIIEEIASSYNWLLTDIDSDYSSKNLDEKDYDFLSGEEFIKLIKEENYTYAWGVFSAIPRGINIGKVMETDLPYANGYTGFWENSITIQNPLATIEMVLWDGELALIISRDEKVTSDFMDYYKLSEDLETYNNNKG